MSHRGPSPCVRKETITKEEKKERSKTTTKTLLVKKILEENSVNSFSIIINREKNYARAILRVHATCTRHLLADSRLCLAPVIKSNWESKKNSRPTAILQLSVTLMLIWPGFNSARHTNLLSVRYNLLYCFVCATWSLSLINRTRSKHLNKKQWNVVVKHTVFLINDIVYVIYDNQLVWGSNRNRQKGHFQDCAILLQLQESFRFLFSPANI